MINRLQQEPCDLALLKECQGRLIINITKTESRIKNTRLKSKELKSLLRKGRPDKSTALNIKRQMEVNDRKLRQYQWLLYVWRSFGDAIVFIYVDKWGARPFLCYDNNPRQKESPGHLNGKEGLPAELWVVFDAINHNVPAILCDLTNSIRHGDVCLLGASDPYVIEVKSSVNRNKRVERQERQIRNIHSYLENDGGNTRGFENCKRVVIEKAERNYIPLINEMIDEAVATGKSIRNPERGLRYFVFQVNSTINLDEAFRSISKPIVYDLNEMKNEEEWVGIYPFTLSIIKPAHLYAFLSGSIYMLVILDYSIIEEIARERSLSVKLIDDPGLIMEFEKLIGPLNEPLSLKVSAQFLVRMVLEFISLEWMFDNYENNIQYMLNQALNFG
jgi:hypothetical protein